ncbi:hypothetical protein [Pontibaca salina]|uniref:Uncharacterized protein n=1 Tax=Pontibaca salina TaxID=2795731 RepID=A0A934HR48_9RHOB|nr:hypothetical protein [Pontibaca salina]MBI6629932.1 hypothetical protein [Pontibaca salina]
MSIDLSNVSGDANKFVDQVTKGIGDIAQQLKVNKALVFNHTDKPVNFYVYNYADNLYWISAMHTLVAPGKVGAVAASGVSFKVHPGDNTEHQFLVEPGKAYLYHGPGSVEEVKE